ncbi:MAG: hypothetical protein P8Z67_00095 [Gammaproteobacteria bacterium]
MKLTTSILRKWILLAITLLALAACSTMPANMYSRDSVSAAHPGPWKDAVKAVCSANQVKLSKILNNSYNHNHTLVVSFPHDPKSLAFAQYFNHLYARLLVANHMHNYTLRDQNDGLEIQINWNKTTKVMSTIYVPLQNSLPGLNRN